MGKILVKRDRDHVQVTSNLVVGNRVPKHFFATSGKGQSDITIHAGSFHLALKDAGIEQYNIMTYSSILPGIAEEVAKPDHIVHGSVMESILACADAEQGERATAGIIYGWLSDKRTGSRYGGLVCEYNGHLPEQEAVDQLHASLDELYTNGFSDQYNMGGITLMSESFVPEKKFGTALVAICFTSYVFPVLNCYEPAL